MDCWHVPELQLSIGYTYHPVPPLGPSPQANVSTPEKEELLLSPIRAPHRKKSPMEIIKVRVSHYSCLIKFITVFYAERGMVLCSILIVSS